MRRYAMAPTVGTTRPNDNGQASALAQQLRQQILTRGPMKFSAWMHACLYGPAGYYMRDHRKTGPGPDADFATSPTLHPFLAECVAREIAATWRELEQPMQVIEFGGGAGDLCRDALRYLHEHDPHCLQAIEWIHIEASPYHRQLQANAPKNVSWMDEMPVVAAGFVIAHEFLDALPVDMAQRVAGKWVEMLVGPQGWMAEAELPLPDEAENGDWMPMPAAADAWCDIVKSNLQSGRVLVVDYGGVEPWRHASMGTLRTFRAQQDGGSPLTEPGEKDITASIDFQRLARAMAPWSTDFVITQEEWLLRHGILDALNGTDRSTKRGASEYLRLRQLLLPTGLGAAFKVARFSPCL